MMSSRGRLERGSEIKPRGDKERVTACIQPLQPHETFQTPISVWQPMSVINHEYNITHKM